MGQPNPPGDLPLIEGLDSSWNEFVSAIPEDRRAELGPKLKERVSGYSALTGWEDLHKSGITPDQASTALGLFATIENNPREVYDTIGKHLGITASQAEDIVEQLEENEGDPRLATLQQQVEVLTQIALAQRQMTAQEAQQAEQDKAVEKEISDVIKKYGDVPEDELVMRMLHKGMTAEQAYQEYTGRANELMKRRPAPRIMGSGGVAPSNAIDVKKLDNAGTKSLVAQMIEHANQARNG